MRMITKKETGFGISVDPGSSTFRHIATGSSAALMYLISRSCNSMIYLML